MRKTIQIDLTSEQIEALLNELQAIDYWDRNYETDPRPAWEDTVAYISRQRRRGEIRRLLIASSEKSNEYFHADCSDFVTRHTRFPARAIGGISFWQEEIVGNHNLEKPPYLSPKATKVGPAQAEQILRDRTKCTDSEAKTILESLLREQRRKNNHTVN
jgi:hypothetical protein